ncbi:MAG: LicD family protein [Clostridia bacterium]|nr:LicD family protein [Clostridia bacterium]
MEDTQRILDQMHGLHLILADEVKRICDKHNIKYFMIAGTLLGAVRHKGFIPWDDDMDFGMLRQDYEKFISVCEFEIDESKFYLQTDKKDKFYTFNFAKLRLCGTRVLEGFSSKVNTNQGIYIDIFPIDNVPDSKIAAYFQFKRFWFYRSLLWVKCGYGSDAVKKKNSFRVAKFISKFFSIKYLKKRKLKIITKYKNKMTKKVVTSDGSYGLNKETLDRTWVDTLKEYAFEDRQYPGVADYNAYLSYFYGDYMQLPPENDRNHHGRLEVDFGEYSIKGDK